MERQLHQREQRHARGRAAPPRRTSILFWDSLHPTETGHQAIADMAEEQLSGRPGPVGHGYHDEPAGGGIGQPYTGPVSGLQQQYINITTDSLNILPRRPTGSFTAAVATMRLRSAAAPTCWMAAQGQTSSPAAAGRTRFSSMIADHGRHLEHGQCFMPVTPRRSGA